jgi:hypothetical protein
VFFFLSMLFGAAIAVHLPVLLYIPLGMAAVSLVCMVGWLEQHKLFM